MLRLTFIVGLVVTATWCATPGFATDRPNILLLVSDDHNYEALGCAGHPVLKTPALDRLAREGVRFTHCFTPNPICTPSRACILTGQDSWTNGCVFFGEPIDESSPTWPRLLSAAGYETFYTGKWHNDGQPSSRGFTAGADIWVGGQYDHTALPVIQFGQKRSERKPATKFASTLFADAAIRFLESRDKDKPFAMFVSFTAPHDPWTPPPPYDTMYDPAKMPVPDNFMPRPPYKVHETFPTLRDQSQLPFPRTKADVQRGLGLYYGMITQMDAQIGRILDALDVLKLADDTLVLFVGDHGYSMGSHGFVGKQTMNEEGIRTPLIVRYPRLQRGEATSDALTSLVDILPTFCEAAGIDVPKSVEGFSLLGLYRGDGKHRRNQVFSSFHSPTRHFMDTRCIRTTRYKLVQHMLTGETELFDLEKDAREMTNLIEIEAHAKVREELAKELDAWRARVEKR